MRLLASIVDTGRALLTSVGATVLALTPGETWLLRAAVLLFLVMVAFCVYIWRQVRESVDIAKAANDLATHLDERTAALEEQLGPKG